MYFKYEEPLKILPLLLPFSRDVIRGCAPAKQGRKLRKRKVCVLEIGAATPERETEVTPGIVVERDTR